MRHCSLLLISGVVLLSGAVSDNCRAETASPEILVGSELEFPPYAFVDENGKAAGFSIDLIRAVTEAMGISTRISTGTWDTVWTDLVDGRIDVLPIVAKLPERTSLVDFSLPHTETFDAFFVRDRREVIRNIEGARGKEIAVMRSDAAHHALLERDFQGRLVLVDTIPEGLSLVASGRHDAFLCSKLIGTLAINMHGIKGLTAGPPVPDYKRVFSFAVKKGDTELLEKLNQGLLIVKASGEYQEIYDRWLSAEDPLQKYRKYLVPFILAVAALILAGGFWLFMLRRQVSKRTRELTEKNEMLTQLRDGLDMTVARRTAELSSLNDALLSEIAERKRTEEALRVSEERLRLAVSGGSIGIWEWDIATNQLDWNEQIKAIFGLPSDTTGLTLEKFMSAIYPDDLAVTERSFRSALEQRTEFKHEYRIIWPDGSVHWIVAIGRGIYGPEGLPIRMLGCVLDITGRKRTEEEHISHLRFLESLERVDRAMHQADSLERMLADVLDTVLSIFESDRAWLLFPCDPDAASWSVPMEKTRKEYPGAMLSGVNIPTNPEASQLFLDAINSSRPIVYDPNSGRPLPKESIQFAVQSQVHMALYPKMGKPWLFGMHQCSYARIWSENDLLLFTEIGRRIADGLSSLLFLKDLSDSEERFRTLTTLAPIGIYLTDSKGSCIYVNSRWCEIAGMDLSEAAGEGWIRGIHPEDRETVISKWKETVESAGRWELEYRFQTPDNQISWVYGLATPLLDEAGRVVRYVGINMDITERKQSEEEKEKLQAQLLQAQKMEAIGHLAGGVAHDFNNILSAIVGYAHVTLMKMKKDDPLRNNIDQILASSERAGNLTKSLLAFSRKQVMQMTRINISDVVLGMTRILDRIIGEDIYLKVNTADHGLMVSADVHQIEQVLMNLATNARDAMPEGGTLTVTTDEFEIDDEYVRMHHEGQAGKYAVLTVSDTGTGMDEKTKEYIFDPFFTTKEVGKGTGLGLAMIYGTIKQHNGFINFYSEPGKGTTFRIYLPLSVSEGIVTENSTADSIPSGTETVLLVEDDEAVRSATKGLLKAFGYTVLEAGDATQAVDIYMTNKEIIQLVITDMIMPGRSGKELHNELVKITGDIKMLFVSGYPADMLAKKEIADNEINFISKPFKPDMLLRKVREVLDK